MTDPTDPAYDFANFAGYAIPNTTQIPDEFLDYQMAFLTGAEVKVMLYIFRRTLGFKRYADNISLNQLLTGIVKRDGTRLDHGTGLSKSTLLNAIKSLVEKKLIVVEQRQSDDRGNEPTTYKLNLSPPLGIKNDLGVSENHTPLGIKNDLALDRKLDQALVLKIDPTIYSITTDSIATDSNNNNTRARDFTPPAQTAVVVALLTEQGISKSVAQNLAATNSEAAIREKLAFLDFLEAERPADVQKPAAWLRRAIEQDYGPPDGFVSEAERQRQQAAAERQRQQTAKVQARQQAAASAQAKAQQRARDKLQRTHNTPQPLIDAWHTVLEDLRLSGQSSLYVLLANSLALDATEDVLTIAIASPQQLEQLAHPKTVSQLKRIIKQVTKQAYAPHFVLAESIA